MMPITIVFGAIGAVVPGTCLLTSMIIKKCREKSAAKQRRKELIKKRMVGQIRSSRPHIPEVPDLNINNDITNMRRTSIVEYYPPHDTVTIDMLDEILRRSNV